MEDRLIFRQLEEKFQSYFNQWENKQILFSGPFGTGKTTFLKEFFEERKDVETFRIFPVNYVLHANTDIFEILKYDIILELIHKKAFQEIDISNLTKYIYLTAQNADHAVGKLVGIFSETGKSIGEALGVIDSTLKEAKENRNDLTNPELSIKAFTKTTEKLSKYSYEDYITSLIREKLKTLSDEHNKMNVLIVDDMDRIDPEHLFRIISVFSSHIDSEEGTNKFGFDKIIFVGDNDNFRAIFCHRYGRANNYDAYISKLSSRTPFIFDPAKELYSTVYIMLDQIRYQIGSNNRNISIYGDGKNLYINRLYNYIISSLIQSKAISLRDLKKLIGIHPEPNIEYARVRLGRIYHEPHHIFPLYFLLVQLIPDFRRLSDALESTIIDPLNIDSIIEETSENRRDICIELSEMPLRILMSEHIQPELAEGRTIEKMFGQKKYFLNCKRDFNTGKLIFEVDTASAHERELIALTYEAIKIIYSKING